MTRVRIAPPDTEEDITAEQVAAYLLRPGSGWAPARSTGRDRAFYRERSDAYAFALDGEVQRETIEQIARAEVRHPFDVLAAIVGPARAASVGRACAVGMDGPWLWGGCNRLDGKCGDSASRGAGEESE